MTPSADEVKQDIEAAVDLPRVLFGASRVDEVGFPGPVIAVDRLAKRRVDRARNADPSRFVILCASELQAWLARRDLPRAGHITLEEYAEGLSREKPRYQAPLTTLIELFSRARYSTEKLDPEEAISAYAAFASIVSSTDAKT